MRLHDSARWLIRVGFCLAAMFFAFAIWAMMSHSAENAARGNLSDAQGTYEYAQLGQATNPTWQQAETVTANDVALANALNEIDADQAAITDTGAHFTVARVLAGLCAAGSNTLIAAGKRLATSKLCGWCHRRVHVAASVCPHCHRDSADHIASNDALA